MIFCAEGLWGKTFDTCFDIPSKMASFRTQSLNDALTPRIGNPVGFSHARTSHSRTSSEGTLRFFGRSLLASHQYKHLRKDGAFREMNPLFGFIYLPAYRPTSNAPRASSFHTQNKTMITWQLLLACRLPTLGIAHPLRSVGGSIYLPTNQLYR